ncbi:MAG TPA: flagellar motor switch protein FliN [Phycisphaerae bacterium]|nr:flagellar motor switch protein FliN [Phycisphaerae bacterium]
MSGDPIDGILSQDDLDKAMAEVAGDAGKPGDTLVPAAADVAKADDDAETAAEAEHLADNSRVDSAGRPFDAVAAAMAAAIESEQAIRGGGGDMSSMAIPPGAMPMDIPALEPGCVGVGAGADQGIDLLRDVRLNVKIELGRSRMLVEDVLRLGEGSVVELDKLAGDPVDVFVNDRLVARGEVLVLNDNFCVRINDIAQLEVEEVGRN